MDSLKGGVMNITGNASRFDAAATSQGPADARPPFKMDMVHAERAGSIYETRRHLR